MLFRRCCCLHLSFNPQTFSMRGMKRPKGPKHRLNVHYASARLEKKRQWESKLIQNHPKRHST